MLHLCYFLKINISSLKKKFLKKIGNLCNHKDITVRKCIVLSKDSYINITHNCSQQLSVWTGLQFSCDF